MSSNDFGGGNTAGHQDMKRVLKDIRNKLNSNKPDKVPEAFKTLSEICNRDGESSEAYNLRGSCYYLMGDFQRALYDYSVAIRLARDN